MEGALLISIRLMHKNSSVEAISRGMREQPTGSHEAGKPRFTPKGKRLNGFYTETHWFYRLEGRDDSNVDLAVEAANLWLEERGDFVKEFVCSGGTVDYYITLGAGRFCAFELPLNLINKCAELGVSLGVEVFLEEEA
ncbi:hypothetical protein [Chitiniphilus eburneus]|uniref:DUF4279 domain-containing protein n=1 Tax=Chitiniphilus eburneus TaxID=2571148 RepID=A0A4U0Q7Y0_9NEIS|nr:hypothetical protein [Chitiniphilus eburneus]TJZ77339.1 hypothetical protein FAZ21_03080 [Chitiniphilus eburneus]